VAPKGVLGGIVPDPDAGKPYRHVRQKLRLRLLMADLGTDDLEAVIWTLAGKRPDAVLDAVLAVLADTGEQAQEPPGDVADERAFAHWAEETGLRTPYGDDEPVQ
jgi:hypothetical protein